MKTNKTMIAALVAGSALVALPVLAQPGPAAPAAPQAAMMDEAGAVALLESWGFERIRLDDVEDRHFEFDVVDADGRAIEIEIAFDGTLRAFDVDGDRQATSVDLRTLLPAGVQDVLTERGIVDVHDFEAGPRHFEVEGYTAEGREIEVEIRNDDRVGTISVEDSRPMPGGGPAGAPDQTAIVEAVEASGFAVRSFEQKGRHIEVSATNPEGENVILHVDFAGEIYREVLDRSVSR